MTTKGFMKVIENLNENVSLELAQGMVEALQERQFTLEMQEPMSDGMVYDNWCEKYDEIEDLCCEVEQLVELLEDNASVKEIKKQVERICNNANLYQSLYGGLIRLKCSW